MADQALGDAGILSFPEPEVRNFNMPHDNDDDDDDDNKVVSKHDLQGTIAPEQSSIVNMAPGDDSSAGRYQKL